MCVFSRHRTIDIPCVIASERTVSANEHLFAEELMHAVKQLCSRWQAKYIPREAYQCEYSRNIERIIFPV